MRIIYHLEDLRSLPKPVALTIGVFDGLHLGHLEILKKMQSLTKAQGGSMVMITFASSPLETIQKGTVVPKIISLEEKIELLKIFGVHTLVLLEFNESIRHLTYAQFMKQIIMHMPIDFLVLGKGAAFGLEQKGDEEALITYGQKHGFKCHYLKKLTLDGETISSKHVRDALKLGNMEKVRSYLGRPYSLYAPSHLQKLQEVNSHLIKVSYDFPSHCPIPPGDYIVNLECGKYSRKAFAHLTSLSTTPDNQKINLEIVIMGSISEFMNDQVKIELLHRIDEAELKEFQNNLLKKLNELNEIEPPQSIS